MTIIFMVVGVIIIGLLAFIIYLLSRPKSEDVSSKVDALLSEKFLNFQSNIDNKLDRTRSEVERSKDVLSESFRDTVKQMSNLQKIIQKMSQQQEEAQKLGQSLKDILQVPKLRGSYGETILEEMLERVLPKGIWEKQFCIDGREAVDAIVRFKDVIIPIDSKFPRADYRRYLEAEDDAERQRHWRAYEAAVKLQIKSIASKYIKPEKGTSDFALMFIPSDATYYETIAEKNYLGETSKLYEFAQQNHVVPVSPNTFYAFLQIIIAGIRQLEIITSAKKLHENLSTMQKSFEFFFNKFEDIGKHLDKASESYQIGEKHIQSYKKKLDNTLQLEEFEGEKRLREERE